MNEWINRHKQSFTIKGDDWKSEPIEAIPVTALEELVAKGKKAAEELVFASADNYINNNDDVQKTFSNNNNELPVAYQVYVDAFNEAYATAWALREIEVQELRAEVERLKGALETIVQLKDWKDKHGKDGHYLTNVDNAWLHARLTLNPKQ